MNKTIKENKGQALLFVIVALTISTVVGVAVATRTLSVTKRVSSTDTFAKVYYAAEAGIERFVGLPTSELIDVSDHSNCGSTGSTLDTHTGACYFPLPQETGGVRTRTDVSVSMVNSNATESSTPYYSLDLTNGSYSQVILETYTAAAPAPLTLCWNTGTNADKRALYYSIFDTALRDQGILVSSVGSSVTPDTITGTPTVVTGNSGHANFTNCTTITINLADKFLNLIPLGGDTTAGVFPQAPYSLPNQAFEIVSKATLEQGGDQQQVSKVIKVYRSFDHVSGIFDSAIYAQGDIQ